MLPSNHPIIKHRVRLLNLAGELPNIAIFQKDIFMVISSLLNKLL